MTKIRITKKQGIYKYIVYNEKNSNVYVSESGFKTQEDALKAAKKSYKNYIDSKRISQPTTKIKVKNNIKAKAKELIINNLRITDGGYRLVETAIFGIVLVATSFGTIKVITDIASKLPPKRDTTQEEDYNKIEYITKDKCNFNNLHIILRTAKTGTNGVGTTTSDMLTKLGVSNEIIYKDSDLSTEISNAMSVNPNNDIIVINLETGYENANSGKTILMGDSSNKRKYSSDILASCINASLNEYNLSPIIRSGEKASIWRNETYIERELSNSALIDNVSQLTIDLPITVIDDEIIKNDASASIVEGIMRWSTLDHVERYKNIYYTTTYSDNLSDLCEKHGLSLNYIEENSDINMKKGVRVGNTVLIDLIPKVAKNNVKVDNPCTTTDSNKIKQIVNIYTVQSGDTITKIANEYGVKIEDIVIPSGNPNKIQIGDELYITTYNLYITHKKITPREKKI